MNRQPEFAIHDFRSSSTHNSSLSVYGQTKTSKIPRFSRRHFSILGGMLALLLAGCEANKTIKGVAVFSNEVQEKLSSIGFSLSKDIVQSCKRTKAQEFQISEELFPIDPKSGKRVFILDQQIEALCLTDTATSATKSYEASHRLITEYIAVLGKLAGADLPVFDSQAKALVPALQGMPNLSDEQSKATVDAGGALARILFRVFGEGFQKAKLASTMESSDAPLRTIVTSYANSIKEHYMNGLLASEMISVNAFYGIPLSNSIKPTTSPVLIGINPFITVSLTRLFLSERQEVGKRRAFAQTYITLLHQISCDHTILKLALQGKDAKLASQENNLCKQLDHTSVAYANNLNNKMLTPSAYAAKITPKYQKLLSRLDTLKPNPGFAKHSD